MSKVRREVLGPNQISSVAGTSSANVLTKVFASPPCQTGRFETSLLNDTPKGTIRLARCLLAQTVEEDKIEWSTHKQFLEDELSLKNEMLQKFDVEMEQMKEQLENMKKKLVNKDSEISRLKSELRTVRGESDAEWNEPVAMDPKAWAAELQKMVGDGWTDLNDNFSFVSESA